MYEVKNKMVKMTNQFILPRINFFLIFSYWKTAIPAFSKIHVPESSPVIVIISEIWNNLITRDISKKKEISVLSRFTCFRLRIIHSIYNIFSQKHTMRKYCEDFASRNMDYTTT